MGKKLILCEKPSVAQAVATALGRFKRHDGYIESGDYYIVWAFGHLVDIDTEGIAGREWKLEVLPVLPEKFIYKPISKTHAKQLKVIGELLKKVEEVHLYTDAGREGELIGRLILRYLGWRGKILRFWTSLALTPEIIRKEMKNLRPASEFDSLYYAALARQHADWLVGINLTRAVTLKVANGEVWSVGRVQTPVLTLLYEREIERRNFKPKPYLVIRGVFEVGGRGYEGFLLKKSGGAQDDRGDIFLGDGEDEEGEEEKEKEILGRYAFSLEEGKRFLESLKGIKVGRVRRIIRVEKREAPPKLFSLTSLQRYMNSGFGWKASKTLNILQGIYEKGYVSYPRTDAEYLGEANIGLVLEVLEKLGRADLKERVKGVGRRVFDDSKLTDHHAIIPLDKPKEGVLSVDEAKLYSEIEKRFLAVFMPFYEYESIVVETEVGGVIFETKGIKIKRLGWRELYGVEKQNDLGFLSEGVEVEVKGIRGERRETKPPTRFTEAKVLKVMERLGLGTPATRASIIESLKDVGYIYEEGKGLGVSKKGEALVCALKEMGSGLVSAELTSAWEVELERIYRERLGWDTGYRRFLQGIVSFVREEIEKVKSKGIEAELEVVGVCLSCGGRVIERAKFYICEKECGFKVWREFMGRKLSSKVVRELLEGKEVSLKGLKSRQGNSFGARVKLDKDGKIRIVEFLGVASKSKNKSKTQSKTQSKSKSKSKFKNLKERQG
ncbi:MAG: DNA topoisomerase [Desulfurococcaceae archaeon]